MKKDKVANYTKIKKVSCVVILLSMLISIYCLVCGDFSRGSKEIELLKETEKPLGVESKIKGDKVTVKLTNNTEKEMKNIFVDFPKANRLVTLQKTEMLNSLEPTEDTEISFVVKDAGVGITKNLVNTFGGIKLILVVSLILLLVTGLYFIFRRDIPIKVSTYLLCLSVVLIIGSLVYLSVPRYIEMKTGTNYIQQEKLVISGKDTKLLIKYNQDDVEFAERIREEKIPFETEYTYEESIAITTESTVEIEGINGKKEVIEKYKIINGEIQEPYEINERVLEEPIDQQETKGIKTVIQYEPIEAKKVYIPEDTMKVGQYELVEELSDAEENKGRKEIVYSWDAENKEIKEDVTIIKEPKTNTWKAGTLLVETEELKASTKYIPIEKEKIGYEKEIKEAKDGWIKTTYKVEIDTKTGKQKKNSEYEFIGKREKQIVNGKVEIGVLKESEEITEYKETKKYNDDEWNNYKKVVKEGKDTKKKVTAIMKINEKTGEVTDKIEKVVKEELIEKGNNQIVEIGTKEPYWIQEKKLTDTISYNTVYKEDKTLSGDKQKVAQKGENGRVYDTLLVAYDEDDNAIEGYESRIVEKNVVSKPKDEIIYVAPTSELLR